MRRNWNTPKAAICGGISCPCRWTALRCSNENLKESDFAENEQYKEMIVTVTYMGFNYSFNVRIYKKFNAALSYYSTISFYGDVSMPYISVNTDVEGFTLPEITLSFINSMDVISSLPVGAEEIVSTDIRQYALCKV